MRKNGAVTFRRNRTSVGDEYGAGNPEVRVGCHPPFFRYGRKRGFSPSLNRGLGEGEKKEKKYASTRVRATREKLVDPVWFNNQGWEYFIDDTYFIMCTSTVALLYTE